MFEGPSDRSPFSWLLALVLSVATTSALPAQGGPALTVVGGAAGYDLSGDGTSWVAGAALEFVPASAIVIEPGARVFRYGPQFGPEVTYLLPEMSVQAQLPLGAIRPYLGGGAGGAFVVEGDASDELTLHAAVGARVRVDGRWSIRPELRLRSVDPWAGTLGDFTLGVTRRW